MLRGQKRGWMQFRPPSKVSIKSFRERSQAKLLFICEGFFIANYLPATSFSVFLRKAGMRKCQARKLIKLQFKTKK